MTRRERKDGPFRPNRDMSSSDVLNRGNEVGALRTFDQRGHQDKTRVTERMTAEPTLVLRIDGRYRDKGWWWWAGSARFASGAVTVSVLLADAYDTRTSCTM
ncbi:hypothetical protein CABS01_11855 [Colletotrichum abscissum]|uniref:uncharacterized protein n=1 Tax=Colletotrichum abscissum TaxID=1671311 RepID=UPI0027D4FEE9|nr:uncharacterized protein CABS01_11855 [Colletotrichum abscissum]KAK1492338.1 hypothetical protein CABS01_11855 [Colletotrichum abscissum]